ncbi:uncharacterized protein LOC105831498 isoform X2 [Monomorium pharaonis]|uniref:uncharacterized protein LOC105831498 isoform X2 n=1 Tax=Monomorium pharaonis TaxID=307658 RepID=UPI0017460CD0|nr:uncharacterized protein LOC105831498 isoform X2 [Monomorium pharaonis]
MYRKRNTKQYRTRIFLLTRGFEASKPARSNVTSAISEDYGDEILANMNLTTFKERYRRLIPYMTFYVANNYLNAQTPALAQNYADDLSGTLLRKPQSQQHPLTRLVGVPRRGSANKYRVNSPDQDKKFVPSVQFDPRNIGGDNDYFAPVKYDTKINYAEYSTPSYQLYQVQKTYPEITTPASRILNKENRYFVTARPLKPSAPVIKKPLLGNPLDDYDQDYTVRPNVAVNYHNKEFEGLRYIPSHVNVQQQSVKSPAVSLYRKPNVNLNNLIESFQLSEQLPEMLNKDNLDSSIKTLIEILNILHSTRQENFPQPQEPPLPPPSPSRLVNYDVYKPKIYTRPKVITETRFQVTPSPLIITDDPERYKAEDDDVPIKSSLQPDYNLNHVKDEKVEYYVPYVQDISNEPKQGLRPTSTPTASTTGHSYEITEDLSDDILQDERYTLPISTEASTSQQYVAPNEVTHPGPKMPLPALKYGATRGKPNVDYPAYATIPETKFNCKDQRYKGFFGDPETGCQVWHYCDLNGGKSSFLCPNGTIFSQIALTCDWWFNVKCETTTQLYVLNERLYKYILPIMPKFPEDFTGPEVDRYLELKFKEMEAKMKEKKLKKQQEEKSKHKDKSQTANDEEVDEA